MRGDPQTQASDMGEFYAHVEAAPDLRALALHATTAALYFNPSAICSFFIRTTPRGYKVTTNNIAIPPDHLNLLKSTTELIYLSDISVPIHHPPEVPQSIWLPVDESPNAPALWVIFSETPDDLSTLHQIARSVHHRFIALYGGHPRTAIQQFRLWYSA